MPEINPNKIVVFTGSGISVESGLATFRGADGLWEDHRIEDVASIDGWRRDPEQVLEFYNHRRKAILKAEPNAAHLAIAALESRYETVVITQNIDDLHERAGSKNVLHLHGEILKSRSAVNPSLSYDQTGDMSIGDLCEKGHQLRPDIVWFGEHLGDLSEAVLHLKTAGRVLVVGTSLNVQPAAGLLKHGRYHAEKIVVSYEVAKLPFGYKFLRGRAGGLVPLITSAWLEGCRFNP